MGSDKFILREFAVFIPVKEMKDPSGTSKMYYDYDYSLRFDFLRLDSQENWFPIQGSGISI